MCLALVVIIADAPVVHAREQFIAPEYRVKAVLLYNLVRLVEWPKQSFENFSSSINICFIGKELFGAALNSIRKKKIRNRALAISTDIEIEKTAQCHILFINRSEKENLQEILSALNKQPILTVGDTKGFAVQGCMANFMLQGKRVNLEVNLRAVKSAGLNLSATILKLATIVER
ncbi:MAG: YfiR family protein [Gammaproteobacteria bacterium]|nr:YfiR family protein [Gammaproteobacteria bacterium]